MIGPGCKSLILAALLLSGCGKVAFYDPYWCETKASMTNSRNSHAQRTVAGHYGMRMRDKCRAGNNHACEWIADQKAILKDMDANIAPVARRAGSCPLRIRRR